MNIRLGKHRRPIKMELDRRIEVETTLFANTRDILTKRGGGREEVRKS